MEKTFQNTTFESCNHHTLWQWYYCFQLYFQNLVTVQCLLCMHLVLKAGWKWHESFMGILNCSSYTWYRHEWKQQLKSRQETFWPFLEWQKCVCANAVGLTVLTFHKLMEKSFSFFPFFLNPQTTGNRWCPKSHTSVLNSYNTTTTTNSVLALACYLKLASAAHSDQALTLWSAFCLWLIKCC